MSTWDVNTAGHPGNRRRARATAGHSGRSNVQL